MPPIPRLLAVATAVPPFVLRQDEVATFARRLFSARGSEIERLRAAYASRASKGSRSSLCTMECGGGFDRLNQFDTTMSFVLLLDS